MSMNDPVVIVAAKRTAIENLSGGLSSVPAHELGGQVLTAGAGQNPARQAGISAGVSYGKTAIRINQVCGSGLCGDADVVLAGGQENMSLSPHAIHMRDGVKFGDASLGDTMIKDGLWDAFNDYHMGVTAENIAQQFGLTREAQDEFSARSQNRTEAAIAVDKFTAEIVPITVKKRKEEIEIAADEFPRSGVTAGGFECCAGIGAG